MTNKNSSRTPKQRISKTPGEIVSCTTAFDRLFALAGRQPEIVILGATVGGHLPSGAPVAFEVDVPTHLQPAQALFLDRAADGTITLLSQPALTNGVLRFDEIAAMPPRPVQTAGAQCNVALRYTKPGQHVVLAVLINSPNFRLDRQPLLHDKIRVAPPFHPVTCSVPILSDQTPLDALADRLADLSGDELAISHTTFLVKADRPLPCRRDP